jgi:hypothetical protein
MYPPIKCPVCGRGDLYLCLTMANSYRKKHQSEILKDNKFLVYGETVNFPLDKVFNALQLMQCCRIEIITKDDMIVDIYGLPSLDATG